MASVSRIIKVKNPRRGAVKRVNKRRTRTVNRKGPAIARYNVKQLKKELKRRGVKTSPRRKAAVARRKTSARHRPAVKRNPVLIELGMVNPKRRKSVAKTKRRSTRRRVTRNPRSHSKRVSRVVRTHRRRRAVSVASAPRRRRNGRRRVSRRVGVRRNPSLFGQSGGKSLAMMVGGGLVGVAATKFLPTLIPASIMSSIGSSKLMGVGVTLAGAFAAGMIAKKFDRVFGEAVLFGGLMQAGSAALNAFAPPSIAGQLALSGVGDIVPGWYAVPQNPILGTGQPVLQMPAAPQGTGNMKRWGNMR